MDTQKAAKATRRPFGKTVIAAGLLVSIAAVIAACGGGSGGSAGGSTQSPATGTSPADSSGDVAIEEPSNTGTDRDAPNPVPPTPARPATVATAIDPSFGISSYYPLFAFGTPMTEQLQYREADGTLVTLMGMRPTERHARERGEDWNEPDKGPGRYLTFPSAYFQNRTYGIEIRDYVPAGKQLIEMTLIVNDGTFDGTTFSLFRNSNDEGVRDYGWSLNTGFNNPNRGGKPICTAGSRDCDRAFVGQGERGVELGGRALRQFLRLRGAHEEGEVGTAVQFREGWDVVHTVYLYSHEPLR